jgi:hypothetical protein
MPAIEAQQNQVYSPPDKRSQAEAVLAKNRRSDANLQSLIAKSAALFPDASSRSANWKPWPNLTSVKTHEHI